MAIRKIKCKITAERCKRSPLIDRLGSFGLELAYENSRQIEEIFQRKETLTQEVANRLSELILALREGVGKGERGEGGRCRDF